MDSPSPTITDLPASAQRVLADHLKPSEAANCRLASRLLAQVAPDRAATRLWVVASSFAAQLEADGRSTAAAAAASSSSGLFAATSLARAAQGVVRAEVLVDASRTFRDSVWQALFEALLSSPTLQDLTVAEYASTASKAVGDALITRQIVTGSGFSWSQAKQEQAAARISQAMHGSSSDGGCSSSSSSRAQDRSTVTAADCAWVSALVEAAERRQAQQQQQQQQDTDATAAAAAEATVAAAAPQMHLTLQLLAPLAPQHCIQIVQLQGLVGLVARKTPAWLDNSSTQYQSASANSSLDNGYADFPHEGIVNPGAQMLLQQAYPVLATGMLRQLRSVPLLRSLSCTVGGPVYGEKPGEVGTMLQSLLSEHLPHLTQLSLGTAQHSTPGRPVHYSLSAPLRMPALVSLTCNLGFSLDVESDIDDESMQHIRDSQQQPGSAAAAGAAESNSSSSSREGASSAAAAAASPAGPAVRKPLPELLPSLTKLVLIDPACVADVIERATTSKAACSQLQHLEIPELQFDAINENFPDYNAFSDQQQQQQQARPRPDLVSLQRLGQLGGLRQLATVLRGQRQLDALVAAVGSQLQGLTVTCQVDENAYLHSPFSYAGMSGEMNKLAEVQLPRLFKGMQQLTSLKVIGSTGAVLDPSRDLPAAVQHLTALRSLSYTGRVHALPARGFDLQPGMLPPTLQGLTLVVRQSGSEGFDADGRYTLHQGSLPEGLTSLKCRGFWWQRPAGFEPWNPWLGWECMPAGLRQLEVDCEAPLLHAGPGSILPVSCEGSVQQHPGNAQPGVFGGGNSSVPEPAAAQLLISTSSWGSAVSSDGQQEEPAGEVPVADQAAAVDASAAAASAAAASAVAVTATSEAAAASPEAAAAATAGPEAAAGDAGGAAAASDDSGCELHAGPEGCSEAQPQLVGLPALESLALFVRANRYAKEEKQQVGEAESGEEIENPAGNKDSPEAGRLPLDSLLSHLSGLTRLTHLHISSTAGGLQYIDEDRCQGLSSLRALKVLTLDMPPPVPRRSSFGGRPIPQWLTWCPQDLVSGLSEQLPGAAGSLRALRLPALGRSTQADLFEALAALLPNCLVVEADEIVLDC